MHQFIVIRRPDDPEDIACHAYKRVFKDVDTAKEFAKRVAAREQEDFDGTIISYSREVVLDHTEFGGKPVRWRIDELITNSTDRFCPHCGKRVKDSDVGDYRWQCTSCDEDFYDFECDPHRDPSEEE